MTKWTMLFQFERVSRVVAVLCTVRSFYLMFVSLSNAIRRIELARDDLTRWEHEANERLSTPCGH